MIVILVVVRKRVPVLQALIADQQAEVQLVPVPPIVKVEKQVAVREKVQVNETIVVPIIEITVPREIIALPVPVAVVPVVVAVVLLVVAAVPLLTGVAVARALLEAAVALPGAMFLAVSYTHLTLPTTPYV